jgi:hypothetical protein
LIGFFCALKSTTTTTTTTTINHNTQPQPILKLSNTLLTPCRTSTPKIYKTPAKRLISTSANLQIFAALLNKETFCTLKN